MTPITTTTLEVPARTITTLSLQPDGRPLLQATLAPATKESNATIVVQRGPGAPVIIQVADLDDVIAILCASRALWDESGDPVTLTPPVEPTPDSTFTTTPQEETA